ncbi:hypothetical protein [Microseira sp. BLCC-F43]|jgi:hypothetical protein|uniref:hypothetical protein n=1 Tax=Microseira sp. BLCC-F43 TaxID=3153602 RepID=UPI0035BB0B60
MKRLILASLSVLLLSAATAPTVKAEPMAVNSNMMGRTSASIRLLEPFYLVGLAYQGYFREQGIPSYGAFLAAYHTGRINARDLVQSAIKDNRLPASALQDEDYLNAVEMQLMFFDTH